MGDGANLTFGLKRGVPKGCTTAWGARLIVSQDGYTDFVHDRQDAFGEEADKDKLFAWLGSGAVDHARKRASDLLRRGEMNTRMSRFFSLFKDEQGEIVGDTNASAGYLYVTAFLFEHLPFVQDPDRVGGWLVVYDAENTHFFLGTRDQAIEDAERVQGSGWKHVDAVSDNWPEVDDVPRDPRDAGEVFVGLGEIDGGEAA